MTVLLLICCAWFVLCVDSFVADLLRWCEVLTVLLLICCGRLVVLVAVLLLICCGRIIILPHIA